ncbi:hypothetical protein C8A05DRAFT_32587 [Staphylotrichum tortipilum]|uniref:CFEM domain-containing protein n=1 Tax=Staphylotrichum tortipilum TaxID=2831512 RepID=A0AAN6RU86_9PEZI|nr:hypothetical protein C8A05DRAFT_32587 [Staphylotrichum longicolle]
MRFTISLITALAALASASPALRRQASACPEADAIPACGATCIKDAVTQIGCADADYACMCAKFSELQSAAANCVVAGCGLEGALAVLSAAQAVCTACVPAA